MAFQFLPEHFRRHDESPDGEFYAVDRLVTHIDDAAIATLGGLYAELIPRHSLVLDLMSSWVSHFRRDHPLERLIGLGMNANELRSNPRLDGWLVHDLNRSRGLIPLRDRSFEAVVCAVSIQYLVWPVRTFIEVWRVLRPGGVCVVSFSNRCFPTKAVFIWQALADEQRLSLVAEYFQQSGDWSEIRGGLANPGASGDPLYAVWARKGPEQGTASGPFSRSGVPRPDRSPPDHGES